MSFHPAVSDFSTDSLLTLEGTLTRFVGVTASHLPQTPLNHTHHRSAAKLVKRRMARARKARARLRKQNRLRAHQARN